MNTISEAVGSRQQRSCYDRANRLRKRRPFDVSLRQGEHRRAKREPRRPRPSTSMSSANEREAHGCATLLRQHARDDREGRRSSSPRLPGPGDAVERRPALLRSESAHWRERVRGTTRSWQRRGCCPDRPGPHRQWPCSGKPRQDFVEHRDRIPFCGGLVVLSLPDEPRSRGPRVGRNSSCAATLQTGSAHQVGVRGPRSPGAPVLVAPGGREDEGLMGFRLGSQGCRPSRASACGGPGQSPEAAHLYRPATASS